MSHDHSLSPERTASTAGTPLLPVLLAVASATVSTAAPTPLAGQFSVRPVIVDYPSGPAATRAITVKNEGAGRRTFRVYVADFDRAPDGKHTFLGAGEHERSCRDRISVFPDHLTVEPGGTADARITLEPGARTCWSLVFFETVLGDTTGVRIGQRVGVKVFGAGRGAEAGARVEGVAASPAGGSVRVVFEVVNSGGTVLRPSGGVEIRTAGGRVVSTRELRSFSVLPGHRRRIDVEMAAELGPGRYLAVPLLDIGAEYLVGGQAGLRVPGARPADAAAGG